MLKFSAENNYVISEEAKQLIIEYFKSIKNSSNFGNARNVRNLWERCKIKQANRLMQTGSNDLNVISLSDIDCAIKSMNEPKEKLIGFELPSDSFDSAKL